MILLTLSLSLSLSLSHSLSLSLSHSLTLSLSIYLCWYLSLLSIPIINLTPPSVCINLINVSFCWLTNTCVCLCRSPLDKVTYELFHVSQAVLFMNYTFYSCKCCCVMCCFYGLFKTAPNILVYILSSLSSKDFVRVKLRQPFRSIETAK